MHLEGVLVWQSVCLHLSGVGLVDIEEHRLTSWDIQCGVSEYNCLLSQEKEYTNQNLNHFK